MKTTQLLTALFPLAVMATNHESHTTDIPTSTTTSSPLPTTTGTTKSTNGIWTELGCYKINPSAPKKQGNNLLAPATNPIGFVGTSPFNNKNICSIDLCAGEFKYVATQGNKCFCADEIDELNLTPTTDESESVCTMPCPGYDLDKCGGLDGLTVYVNEGIPDSDAGETTTSSKSAGSGNAGWTVIYVGTTIYPSTSKSTSASTSGSESATASKTGGAAESSKTGGVEESGASSLVRQSATLLMAVCGLGAILL